MLYQVYSTWTLKHTDITPTKSVQSLILISITIKNIISLAHFKKTIIITLFLKKWAATRDFRQCGTLRSVDSGEPVRPSVELRNFQMKFGRWLGSHGAIKRLAKALIRLRVCAGWSEPLLVAHTWLLEIKCPGSNKFASVYVMLCMYTVGEGP